MTCAVRESVPFVERLAGKSKWVQWRWVWLGKYAGCAYGRPRLRSANLPACVVYNRYGR